MLQLLSLRSHRRGLCPGWLLRVALVLVFCLQVFMETQHHHELGTVHDDCVACDLAMQFSGGAPAFEPVLPALLLVAFFLLQPPRYRFQLPSRRHLLPFAHAPPVVA